MSEVSTSNGKKKNKKADKNLANSSSNDIISAALPSSRSLSSRIGPRTYKIVILGEGGVGKSGESSENHRITDQISARRWLSQQKWSDDVKKSSLFSIFYDNTIYAVWAECRMPATRALS